jgi:hypothetical protein
MKALLLLAGSVLIAAGVLTKGKKSDNVAPNGAKSVPTSKKADDEPETQKPDNLPSSGELDNVDTVENAEQTTIGE